MLCSTQSMQIARKLSHTTYMRNTTGIPKWLIRLKMIVSPILQLFDVDCTLEFKRAILKITSNRKEGTTLKIKRDGEDYFRDCFTLPLVHIDYKVFTAVASYSGSGKSNWHILHSIEFNDMEEVIKSEGKHTNFNAEGQDILNMGNKDSALVGNTKESIYAINR